MPNLLMNDTGLILFAHGARDPAWAAPFEATAELVRRARPGLVVRLAFLEFMSPTLAEAGSALAAAGCTTVHLVPMFLGTGGHVRRDLPLLVQALRDAHPGLAVTPHAAIGEMPAMHLAMATAIGETLGATLTTTLSATLQADAPTGAAQARR
jgi:sirohydrochlorin cobaltochelatase